MITIKIKPMTFNSVYSTARTGRRFMTKEGKQYKALIAAKATAFDHLADFQEALKFTYELHGPWLTKKNMISKTAGDLDGASKLLIDAVCDSLNINDACIVELSGKKVLAESWCVKFHLGPSTLGGHLPDGRAPIH